MNSQSGRTVLTVSSAVAMLLAAAAADAQESTPANLGQVVVTAQKRAEIQQDVPISISVVNSDDLTRRGATSLSDYSAFVAGMQVDNNGKPGTSTVSLRGIGPLGSSATVGTYLDDGPIGSGSIYNSTAVLTLELLPYDIQRVELLRGPQGTLYGASSIGGLLKYVTIPPSLDGFEARVGVEAYDVKKASDESMTVNARVSFPLVTDKVGMSLSYAKRELPAYIDNITTGESDVNEGEQEGARVAFLWQPSESSSIGLSAMRQEVDTDDNAVLFQQGDGTPIGDGYSSNLILDEPFDSQYDNYALTMNFDLGFATLTSATTWTEVDITLVQDVSTLFGVLIGGLSDLTNSFDQEKLTQEIRLTSPSENRFEWLLGAFYTDEDNKVGQLLSGLDLTGAPLPGLNPLAVVQLPNKYEEYAFFANATYKPNDEFHFTGGLRWAKNDQTFRQISFGAVVPTADVPGKSNEDVLTFSLSPQWHISEDTMLYARAASGYRPGGPNVFLPGVPPTVDSDSMKSYEIGVKSNLAGNTVQAEVAVFFMNWKDIQLAVQFPNGTGGLANAGSAESIGFEGSLLWAVTEQFLFGLNGAFADAELTSDTPATVGGLNGDRLPRTPQWSGALTADYSFAAGSNLNWQFGGVLRYVGDRISEVSSSPLSVRADSYTTLDLNAAVSIGERWTIRAYARNVTDENGEITRSLSASNPGFISVTPLQPRTIGLGVDVRF